MIGRVTMINSIPMYLQLKQMIRLAIAGRGLYDFIRRHVWDRYTHMY